MRIRPQPRTPNYFRPEDRGALGANEAAEDPVLVFVHVDAKPRREALGPAADLRRQIIEIDPADLADFIGVRGDLQPGGGGAPG